MIYAISDHFCRRMPLSSAQFPGVVPPTVQERVSFWKNAFATTSYRTMSGHDDRVVGEGNDVVVYHGVGQRMRTVIESCMAAN